MYRNNHILVGKKEKELYILPEMANRHGLITGASGSGKTVTVKVLAESFSAMGVPVFLADVKGDLAGMPFPLERNDAIEKRLASLDLPDFKEEGFPTHYWDIYGESGHPIRTTISNIGSELLSRMLNLTEAQAGVLTVVFKIAEDNQWNLVDLKDLRLVLQYVGDNRKKYTLEYGNVSLQSIGAIQRNLLVLESQGGDFFFGEPSVNIKDFIRFDPKDGRGYINVLHAVKLFQKPDLYATFLLWLLTDLYNTLPEVGDLKKPKIVFFFDEAHLLFEEMPDYLVKQVIQIVKLIRSKGIGLYFISQSPKDIPDEVLAQLGNRIQHALRAYTPQEQKVVKAAATSFRTNPNISTEEAILALGTGEALISFLNEEGEPNMVEEATILPPQSRMGTITEEERKRKIEESLFRGKYDVKVDNVSAYETLKEQLEEEAKIAEEQELAKEKEKQEKKASTKKKKSADEKAAEKVTNSAMNTLGKKIGNSIFKGLFK